VLDEFLIRAWSKGRACDFCRETERDGKRANDLILIEDSGVLSRAREWIPPDVRRRSPSPIMRKRVRRDHPETGSWPDRAAVNSNGTPAIPTRL